ncbi:MAG: 1-phosphofructokinase family hexose kinase [Thermoguttaceae bacterium]
MKIVTFGLTPAFQRIMVFDSFRLNQVNRASEVHCCVSGKSTNTAIGVETLDRKGESVLLSPFSGPHFAIMKDELDSIGVRLCSLPSQSLTRTCTTLIDRETGNHTELVENGQPLGQDELDLYIDLFREEAKEADMLILTGSLPIGCPKTYYRTLLDSLDRPTPFLCDIRGEELLHVLEKRPLFVKPNREELEMTVGRTLKESRELIGAMQELNRLGANWVVITEGPGTVYLSSEHEVYRFHPIATLESEIVNPIGCGDAMSAAISWGTCSGKDPIQSVQLGIAAATVNLRDLFPCRLDPEKVLQLAESVSCVGDRE